MVQLSPASGRETAREFIQRGIVEQQVARACAANMLDDLQRLRCIEPLLLQALARLKGASSTDVAYGRKPWSAMAEDM